ncbi:MAG: phosphatidate cytidylyltransferase [bacterium]
MMVSISEFFKRTVTALVLLFIMGGAYLHSMLLFSFVLLIILVLALHLEWPRLMGSILSCHPRLAPGSKSYKISYVIISLFYPVLPVLSLFLLNYLYRDSQFLLPLYPFFVGWMADTCGYIFGKKYGKHRMCPKISPNKTWEGFAGSFAGILVLNMFIFSKIPAFNDLSGGLFSKNFWVIIPGISLALTTVAFLGGLFISFLKRRSALKDAGTILPGHGGILDRFDSVFFVVIFVWVMLLYPYFF